MVLDLVSMQHVEGFQTLLQIRYNEITKRWNRDVDSAVELTGTTGATQDSL